MSDHPEQPGPASGGDESTVSAVLRSAGSLLVALSGDLRRLAGSEPREAARGAASPIQQAQAPAPSVPGDATEAAGDTAGQIERTLEEGRQRAHAVVDESVRRARELIERARPSVQSIPDRLQSTLDRLFEELRAIRSRLDRVEQLLAAGRPAIPAPGDPAPPSAAAANESLRPPITPQPAPPLSLVDTAPDSTPSPAPASSPDAPPERPAARAAPADPRPATGVPATPPPPMPHRAPASIVSTAPAPPPQPAAPAAIDEGEAGLVFMPEDGSLIVAVGPVSGFQGLVRVQDALTAHPGVGAVAVEAYARGEARLRLQLAGPVRASELAAQLTDRLTQSTDISEQSEADRSVRLRLG